MRGRWQPWRFVAWVALLFGAACGPKPQDLSTEQLSRVVDDNRPSLKACYDAALEAHPYKREMRMRAVIEVEPSGKVKKVELDEGGLPGMPKCIEAAITKWKFPEAPDPTQAELPIVFQPEVVKQK
jgi:hypothetical protein